MIDLPGLRLHWGFVVALLMAVVVSWFLFKTTKGYELRAAGFNINAARYAGMSASGSIILAMSMSGALAGLGGSMEVLGTVPQMSNDISSGYGFNAIALALLAGNRPMGIVLASLLFGALRTGGGLMQVKTGIPLDLLFFIQALVIMFVAAPGLIRVLYRFDRTRMPGADKATIEGGAA
jgi:simple sugar transport system permease protein